MSEAEPEQPVVLITGAGAGIGLEFARQYAAKGWRIIASHRGKMPSAALVALSEAYDGVTMAQMDVTDIGQIGALAERLEDQSLDLLINNAGITHDGDPRAERQNLGTFDFALWDAIFDTNVRGSLAVSEAFLPHLQRGKFKKLVSISSSHGSLCEPPPTMVERQGTFYCASKAALNRQMQVIGHVLGPSGISVLVINPGAVATERHDEHVRAHGEIWPTHMFISLEQSVGGMIRVIDRAIPAGEAHFVDHDGTEHAW